MADRIQISLDSTAQTLWNKIEEEVNNTYDGGRSEFFRDVLMSYADDKTKLEARREVIQHRIQRLEEEKQELQMQLEGIESRIDEMTIDEKEENKIRDVNDEEFWDRTVRKIMVREDVNSPASVRQRFNKWFEGRHQLYTKKFDSMPINRFKQRFVEEARERGYSDKLEDLKIEVTA